MGFLRRLRGLVGIATTWGVAFSIMMTTLLIGRWALGGFHGFVLGPRQITVALIEFFLMGGLAGTLFSLFPPLFTSCVFALFPGFGAWVLSSRHARIFLVESFQR